MGPAGRLADRTRLAAWVVQPAEPREGVRLHDAVEVAEPSLGMRAGAVGGVEVGRGRRLGSTEGAVVAHHRPEPAGAGLPLGQDRHQRIVEMEAVGSPDMGLDPGD